MSSYKRQIDLSIADETVIHKWKHRESKRQKLIQKVLMVREKILAKTHNSIDKHNSYSPGKFFL
jgi:hypothetical protein